MSYTAEEEERRLFAAIQLPEEWLRALSQVRSDLERVAAGELRWVRTELMHVTLVFLGYVPSALFPDVESAMSAAAARHRPFRLSLGQLGSFGPPRAITVVWAGLATTPAELIGLHTDLAKELSERRIPFDRKPLVPHVTLARGKRPIDTEVSIRVAASLQRRTLSADLTTTVGDFVLMRSRLSPKGPSYEVVQTFALGGPSND